MKQSAEKVLITMISVLTSYLVDLSDVCPQSEDQFSYGEKTAYTECLEYIQTWEKAAENGLAFDIERKFPL